MTLAEEIRQRVIVIAIAPAEVVPRELCYNSLNIASKKDYIPYGEIVHASFRADYLNDEERTALYQKIADNQGQIIWLEPNGTTDLLDLDHALQSPTFIPTIKDNIEEYVTNNGEYK